MAPTMVSKKIMVQSQLLGVSLSDDEEDLNGVDIDTNISGEDQLAKGQSIWDTEW